MQYGQKNSIGVVPDQTCQKRLFQNFFLPLAETTKYQIWKQKLRRLILSLDGCRLIYANMESLSSTGCEEYEVEIKNKIYIFFRTKKAPVKKFK